MLKDFLDIKNEAEPEDVVIRYKDFVIAARFDCGGTGCFFTAEAFYPVETEEEAGVDFYHLQFCPVGGLSKDHFDTEGEALQAMMYTMDFLEKAGEIG